MLVASTMSSQQNSPAVPTKKDLPAEESSSRGGKTKAQIRAENRERQEKQRAAKASAATNKSASGGGDPGGSKPTSSAKPKPVKKPTTQKTEETSERRGSLISAQEQAQSTVADVENKIRDLRIFSHFGARGHLGQKTKGEIHPSILRLGLLFAEYKITGANARCIAALTAFKTVRHSILYFSELGN